MEVVAMLDIRSKINHCWRDFLLVSENSLCFYILLLMAPRAHFNFAAPRNVFPSI